VIGDPVLEGNTRSLMGLLMMRVRVKSKK